MGKFGIDLSLWRLRFAVVRGIFPLRFGGLLLFLLIISGWHFEVKAHANQVLFAVSVSLLFVLGLMVILSTVVGILVAYQCIRRNRGVVVEGEFDAESDIKTGVEVPVPFFIPFIEVSYRWGEPSEIDAVWTGRGLWRSEWIRSMSRGHVKLLRRWVVVGDIFGLTEFSLPFSQSSSLIFRPPRAVMDKVSIVRESSGEGYSHPEGKPVGEMVEMRAYQAGDPLRFVLWKVFARSRELLVRRPEEAIVEQRNALIYMIAGFGDDNSASLGREFLEMSEFSSGEILFSADGSNRVVSEKGEGMEDLVHSSEHRGDGGSGLARVLAEAGRDRLDNCYILVPSRRGVWLERLRHFRASLPAPPVILLGVDGEFLEEVGRSRLSRFFFGDGDSVSGSVREFQDLCRELERLGELRVVHRGSGEVISSHMLEVMHKL